MGAGAVIWIRVDHARAPVACCRKTSRTSELSKRAASRRTDSGMDRRGIVRPLVISVGVRADRRIGIEAFRLPSVRMRSVYRADGPTMASRNRSSTTSQATTFHQALR